MIFKIFEDLHYPIIRKLSILMLRIYISIAWPKSYALTFHDYIVEVSEMTAIYKSIFGYASCKPHKVSSTFPRSASNSEVTSFCHDRAAVT